MRVLATFGLLLIAASTLIVLAGVVRSRSDEPMTLHVIERATTDVVTDTGEAGDTAGDLLTFANEVFDEHNETQIGADQGYCIRAIVGEAWGCFWT